MLTGSHGQLIRGREFLNSLSMLDIFEAETMFDYQTSKHAHFDAAYKSLDAMASAPVLVALRRKQSEKIENNYSAFQF
ncbi:hypothetical protein ACVTWF_003576 [Salmonella enterica subsp. enterica serovar Newport]|uniref:Uncharacterized protein n=1 Tax=Salmonella enterica TaxID=28901 RepID=A0A742VHH7_SALER|nr:hypothetical protein [Salmonella enterica]EBV0138251.1 hypothetical protein [Salmonella enterica subsp. enterica serovar Newport]EBW0807397.1 hypothetical protein [Salmonella enterica subsp. enterica serovar Newport]EBW4809315.1 hypothetical protein [Salmonella enterica subsp. enterica serovar Newport]EBW7815872.1 hypothetical protein [Salmonella enterica subsp. enterica serovar Newport]EBX2950592.1 hypothetical protein [Salmonella enterica subsp. enterica serovar Newport]